MDIQEATKNFSGTIENHLKAIGEANSALIEDAEKLATGKKSRATKLRVGITDTLKAINAFKKEIMDIRAKGKELRQIALDTKKSLEK
jgi:hypothetical protein